MFKKKKKRIEQAKLREIYRIRVNRLELFSLFLVSIPSQELKLEIVERFVSEIDTNANQVQKRKKTKKNIIITYVPPFRTFIIVDKNHNFVVSWLSRLITLHDNINIAAKSFSLFCKRTKFYEFLFDFAQFLLLRTHVLRTYFNKT